MTRPFMAGVCGAAALAALACGKGARPPARDPAAAMSAKARGNEPFWAVIVSPAGIAYKTPELLPDSLTFPLVPPTHSGDTLTWTTSASGRTLTLTVVRAPCQDTMSGEEFAWTASMTLDSASAQGCASVTG